MASHHALLQRHPLNGHRLRWCHLLLRLLLLRALLGLRTDPRLLPRLRCLLPLLLPAPVTVPQVAAGASSAALVKPPIVPVIPVVTAVPAAIRDCPAAAAASGRSCPAPTSTRGNNFRRASCADWAVDRPQWCLLRIKGFRWTQLQLTSRRKSQPLHDSKRMAKRRSWSIPCRPSICLHIARCIYMQYRRNWLVWHCPEQPPVSRGLCCTL